jgi:hypothetical protein
MQPWNQVITLFDLLRDWVGSNVFPHGCPALSRLNKAFSRKKPYLQQNLRATSREIGLYLPLFLLIIAALVQRGFVFQSLRLLPSPILDN